MPSDPPFPAPAGMRWDAERQRFFRPDDSAARLDSTPSTAKRAARPPYRWQYSKSERAAASESSSSKRGRGMSSNDAEGSQAADSRPFKLPMLARNSLATAQRGAYANVGSRSLGASIAHRHANIASFVGNLQRASYVVVSDCETWKPPLQGLQPDPGSQDFLWVRSGAVDDGRNWMPERVDRLDLSKRISVDQERTPNDLHEWYTAQNIFHRAAKTERLIKFDLENSCEICVPWDERIGPDRWGFIMTHGLGVLFMGAKVVIAFVAGTLTHDTPPVRDYKAELCYHPCTWETRAPGGSREQYLKATERGIKALAVNHQVGSGGEDGTESWRSLLMVASFGKFILPLIVREEPDRGGKDICAFLNHEERFQRPYEELYEKGSVSLGSDCIAMQISKDGRTLYAGLRNGTLLVLQTEAFAALTQPTQIKDLPHSSEHRLIEKDKRITVLALISEEELLVGWLDGTLCLVDARQPDRLIRRYLGHCARENPYLPFTFDSKLRLFALAGEDLAIRIWHFDHSAPLTQPDPSSSSDEPSDEASQYTYVPATALRPAYLIGQLRKLEVGAPQSLRGRFRDVPKGLAFCNWTEAKAREHFAAEDSPRAEQKPAPFMLAVANSTYPIITFYH